MNLSACIEHTLLKPEATEKDIIRLCQEAQSHHFFGVCVHSAWVEVACRELNGSQTGVVSVVGFPLGMNLSSAKAFEASAAIEAGAVEIDMVLPIGFLKSGLYSRAVADVQAVAHACASHALKVILETSLLTEEEKTTACKIAIDGGAQFVKTCTGFQGGRAEVGDIKLMRKIVGATFGVKASGGIKTRADAVQLIEAGANRLGTSAGIALLQNQTAPGGY